MADNAWRSLPPFPERPARGGCGAAALNPALEAEAGGASESNQTTETQDGHDSRHLTQTSRGETKPFPLLRAEH